MESIGSFGDRCLCKSKVLQRNGALFSSGERIRTDVVKPAASIVVVEKSTEKRLVVRYEAEWSNNLIAGLVLAVERDVDFSAGCSWWG
jgi:hypothetical protein